MKLSRQMRRIYWKIRKPLHIPLAYVWRRLLVNSTVIGITGSVGKSTTMELLYAILSTQAATVSTVLNQNDRAGVARTLLRARPGTRFVIVEYGTSGPGAIARVGRLVKPDIGVVLSIARTHTRSFNTLDDTAAEKAEIFNHMARGATALVNADDPYVCEMAKDFPGEVLSFGSNAGCDIQHSDAASIWPKRLGIRVKSGGQEAFVQTQLVGTHWASSIAAAISIARICGVSLEDSAKAIAQVSPFMARMQPVRLPNGAIVIRDEYNGSQDTFEKMIDVLKQAQAERLVLIISDVTDRKGTSRKRQVEIGRVAAELAHMAIFCGDHGHHAKKAAIKAGMDPEHCHHVMGLRATSELMKKHLRAGDLVFLKGRTTDHLSRLVFAQYGEFACWNENCRFTITCDVCAELRAQFDLTGMPF